MGPPYLAIRALFQQRQKFSVLCNCWISHALALRFLQILQRALAYLGESLGKICAASVSWSRFTSKPIFWDPWPAAPTAHVLQLDVTMRLLSMLSWPALTTLATAVLYAAGSSEHLRGTASAGQAGTAAHSLWQTPLPVNCTTLPFSGVQTYITNEWQISCCFNPSTKACNAGGTIQCIPTSTTDGSIADSTTFAWAHNTSMGTGESSMSWPGSQVFVYEGAPCPAPAGIFDPLTTFALTTDGPAAAPVQAATIPYLPAIDTPVWGGSVSTFSPAYWVPATCSNGTQFYYAVTSEASSVSTRLQVRTLSDRGHASMPLESSFNAVGWTLDISHGFSPVVSLSQAGDIGVAVSYTFRADAGLPQRYTAVAEPCSGQMKYQIRWPATPLNSDGLTHVVFASGGAQALLRGIGPTGLSNSTGICAMSQWDGEHQASLHDCVFIAVPNQDANSPGPAIIVEQFNDSLIAMNFGVLKGYDWERHYAVVDVAAKRVLHAGPGSVLHGIDQQACDHGPAAGARCTLVLRNAEVEDSPKFVQVDALTGEVLQTMAAPAGFIPLVNGGARQSAWIDGRWVGFASYMPTYSEVYVNEAFTFP